MSDLISRQAAIEAMEQTYCDIERVKKRPVTKGEQAIFLDMRGVVRSLPSVEPERKKGHWIMQNDRNKKLLGWLFCSECNAWIGEPTDYCSNCGADMRG